MNLLHLKYAAEIELTGSINKAARNLYIAQPNLSRGIKELESTLGITIFKRTSKGMVPTAEGLEFLRYAKEILSKIDEVEELYRNGKKISQKFSISVPRASYITEAFAQFSNKIDRSKPVEMLYMETNAMRTVSNVASSDYNLGIVRYAATRDSQFQDMFEENGLVSELITEFIHVLVMNKNNPLADKKEIAYADLENYIEVAQGDPFVPSLSASAVIKEEVSNDFCKRIFVFDHGSQFELLSANSNVFAWVSPIPQAILDKYSLVQKKCIDSSRIYRDVLIHKKDYRLSELDNDFIT
ncbi:MAG: LysR family transcriptional regulator, partial [Ruminiclostridium sp.]